MQGKLSTALIFGFGPGSNGWVLTSLISKLSPGSSKEFRSILIYALFTGKNPTAGFKSLRPNTLISTVTSSASGLYDGYTISYLGALPGSYIPKLMRISPSSVSFPMFSLCHLGVGADAGWERSTSENYL